MSCNRTIYNANSVLNARMSDGRMFTMYRPSGLADDQTFFKENLSDDTTTALNNDLLIPNTYEKVVSFAGAPKP